MCSDPVAGTSPLGSGVFHISLPQAMLEEQVLQALVFFQVCVVQRLIYVDLLWERENDVERLDGFNSYVSLTCYLCIGLCTMRGPPGGITSIHV